MTTRILVVGSGGREHALAWRLQVGNGLPPGPDREVVLAPGNPGAAKDVRCVPCALDPKSVVALATSLKSDLVVIGPEQPLVDGVIDALVAEKILCVGPVAAAAALEGSKAFMKDLCRDAGVPTADYLVATQMPAVDAFIESQRNKGATQLVVKEDGLRAGKGVVVCTSLEQAREQAATFLAPGDGDATQIVIEEFLPGVELSVFGLCDGNKAHLMATARDHKRLHDGDVGPNTGGMGAVGPLGPEHGVTDALLERVQREVFVPTLAALAKRGAPYRGILYAGLMLNGDEMRLLEFNVRLGDPEAQALLFGTDRDLLPTFMKIARGDALGDDDGSLRSCAPVACVVLASEGYPAAPIKGRAISIGEPAGDDASAGDVKIFYAGVSADESGGLVTNGGRVLCVCARGDSLDAALDRAYAATAAVTFEGQHLRGDIGASVRREGAR